MNNENIDKLSNAMYKLSQTMCHLLLVTDNDEQTRKQAKDQLEKLKAMTEKQIAY